jgi:multiple sugar transport system substrate-binding protein
VLRKERDSRGASHSTRIHRFVSSLALVTVIALIALACGGGNNATPRTSTGASTPQASTGGGTPQASTGAETPAASAGEESPEASAPGEQSPEASAPGEATPVPTAAQPSPAALAEGGPDIPTTVQPPAAGADIEIWNHFTGPDGAFFSGLVQKFNEEQQTCRATVRVQLGNVFNQQVVSAALGGGLPEILVGGYDRIPFLASEGVLTDIQDVVDLTGFGPEDFPEAIWNAGVYDGVRYSVPLDTHPAVFFYNKALFEEAGLDPESPPADQAAFEAAIQAINDQTDADGMQMVGSGPGAIFLDGLVFASLFYQGGGEWTNADFTEATFNSPQGVQAAEFMRHLVADLGVPLVESDQEIAAFAAGENAMVLSGVWESTRYATALGDDLGIGSYPGVFGQGQWAGSHQMMLTTAADASPDVRQCSAYFIDWLSANSYNWAEGGQVPARNEVRDAIVNGDASTLNPTLQIIQQVAPLAETVKFLPTIPSGGDLLFLGQGAGEAAVLTVNGTGTAQENLDRAAEFMTARLLQDKQTYGY